MFSEDEEHAYIVTAMLYEIIWSNDNAVAIQVGVVALLSRTAMELGGPVHPCALIDILEVGSCQTILACARCGLKCASDNLRTKKRYHE